MRATTMLAIATVAALAAGADAIAGGVSVPSCIFNGQVFTSPRELRPDEVATYRVTLEPKLIDAPGMHLLSATRVDAAARSILVQLFLTTRPERFPAHHLVHDMVEDAFGSIGPLGQEGEWPVLVEVLVENPAGSGQFNDRMCSSDYYHNRLRVTAAGLPAALQSIVEYHHAGLDHYFMTGDPSEIAALDAGRFQGWSRTGNLFTAYAPYGSGGRGDRVTRFYGRPESGLDSHVYTASSREKRALRKPPLSLDWLQETEVAFELHMPETGSGTCVPLTVPVYRLWNGRTDTNHRYTTDPAVRDAMVARGWIREGYGPDAVALCAVGSR
jgi:hypothetical protein